MTDVNKEVTVFDIFLFHFIIGHGFKLAPVTGKILAQLARDEAPSYDLRPFRISRFQSIRSKL